MSMEPSIPLRVSTLHSSRTNTGLQTTTASADGPCRVW